MANTIFNKINSIAHNVLIRYGSRYTAAIRDHVVDVLANVLGSRSSYVIYDDEKQLIQRKLTSDNNPLSRKSWLHQDFYNKLLADLDARDIVKGRPLDIPIRIARQLVIPDDADLLKNIHYVQLLSRELHGLRKLPEDIRLAEIECLCSFIGSAAMFAKITFPDMHNWIFSIRYRDIHLNPDYINRQAQNSSAFYRYFLPYPANLYFMRCLLFYKSSHKLLGIKKPRWSADPAIQPAFVRPADMADIFTTWMLDKITKHAAAPDASFTLPAFYKAVRAGSLLTKHQQGDGPGAGVPPFILSVQSDEIKCHSYSNIYLQEVLGIASMNREHAYTTASLPKRPKPGALSQFQSALLNIRQIRRSLLTKIDSIPLRASAAATILNSAHKSADDLTPHDALHLKLFAKWLKYRLLQKNPLSRDKYLSIKSLNDQAPMVEAFLIRLSQVGPLDSLSPDVQDAIISGQVYPIYSTHNVKNVLKDFTSYLANIALKGSYRKPHWNASALNKEDAPSMKPFISPGCMQTVLQHFESKFLRGPLKRRAKNPKQLENDKLRAVHKAHVLGMMTELAYYSGMRIHEIALLQVKDIVYDGGIVICVRKTKTNYGVRDIPLSLLAPGEFVSRFTAHWMNRRKEVSHDGLIFTQIDGKVWDTSHVAKEVESVFKEHQVPGMKFHNLRDSYSAMIILRWIAAFHPQLVTKDMPLLSYALFNKENSDNFKKLFLGMRPKIIVDEQTTHIMPVLAKLLGHGGPIVSLQSYVHIVDWLFYLFTHFNMPPELRLTCKDAEDLLQVTYPSLPSYLKGRRLKTIKTRDFLRLQRELVRLPRPAKPAPKIE